MPSSIKVTRSFARRRRYQFIFGSLGAVGAGGMGLVLAGGVGLGVGILLGASAGVLSGWTLQGQEQESSERNSQLDFEIGVVGGDIGAPNLEHPPAKIGAFSKEATGSGSTSSEPASGPFLRPPEG
jgi:hypothetical protein